MELARRGDGGIHFLQEVLSMPTISFEVRTYEVAAAAEAPGR